MFSALKQPDVLRQDVLASLVVFLVALPLCVGVAVASGVPAELGLITGIVGGIVVGCMPGSTFQVSGPAAGLTVLVFEAVREFGLGMLGVIVLATGLLQLALGFLRFGRWFRAISVSVVQGMLAGIGLVLIFGQMYTMAGLKAPRTGLEKIAGIPGFIGDVLSDRDALAAFAVGLGTIAVLVLWKKLPAVAQLLPAPLAAVGLATLVTVMTGLDVATVQVKGLGDAIQVPGTGDFSSIGSGALLLAIVTFTLIASAETLFSAAAVDRLHSGPPTHYDKELLAQGVGNILCGVLGSLPMTAVIVRSSANIHAGARTKLSRVLHGVWLLVFVAALPAAIGVLPMAALAGVLVHAGCKLIPVKEIPGLWREHRGELAVLAVTAVGIISAGMFEGVLLGILLAVVKSAWETSKAHVEVHDAGDRVRVCLTGNATFLRLPRLLESLEALPKDRPIELDLSGARHVDHACRTALENWADRHNDAGTEPVRLRHAASTVAGA
ncbi:SulP family inorganic anion transporter [Streptomyces sp. I05A-00742]|uniref:SulP family inorganic anion transporter n=1 Tax=Streptomyces sp. I05A-00742 TaxID=2732853 RepID=UPI00148997F4|nr:SulP family inorganic anion transporter [Streptomyces sp. I05A-00742]